MKGPLQFTDLEFVRGKLVKIRGVDYSEASAVPKELLEAVARIALRARAPWQQRMFYPIIMPLDKEGKGPADMKEAEALTWEVWDQNAHSYGSYSFLYEAILRAEELNDKFGHCTDEGCEHYGTPHTHTSLTTYMDPLPE